MKKALGGNMKSEDLEAAINNEGLTKAGWQRDAKRAGLRVKHVRNDIGNYWLYYIPTTPAEIRAAKTDVCKRCYRSKDSICDCIAPAP